MTMDRLKLRSQQIATLISTLKQVFINAKVVNGVCTLTRPDGSSFSFLVPEEDYNILLQGDKGAVGDRGDSAFQVYKRNGGTLSETAWLESLKGEQGEAGEPGDDAVDGIDGTDAVDPVIDDAVISVDPFLEEPVIKLLKREDNHYVLDIKFCKSPIGDPGEPAPDEILKIGSVTVSDKVYSRVSVKNDGLETSLDFILYKGDQGIKGNDAEPAIDGTVPDITASINMISEDSVPSVTKEVKEDDIWHLTFNIPKGKKGAIGKQGMTGPRATLVTDINYVSITDDINFINGPDINSFKPFWFTVGDIKHFGYSLRDENKIVQMVFDETGNLVGVRNKSNGYVFGSLTEDWISLSDMERS